MGSLSQFIIGFPKRYRDIFILTVAYGVFAIGGSLYWAAIPILAGQAYLLNTFYLGLVMALIGVVYIITDGPIGVLLDYIGYKKGAIISILFGCATALITILQPSLPMFLVGIVFFALSWNALTHASSAYILYNVPDSVEGRIYGAYGSLYKLGSFIATFFIGYISRWGFINVGVFFLLASLLALLLIAIMRPEKRDYDPDLVRGVKKYLHAPGSWKRGLEAMKEFSPVSWVMAFDGFVGYVFSSAIWFVIPLSLSKFANPFLPEGMALGIFEFAGIVFIAIGGFLADRYSKKMIFLSLLLFEVFTTLAIGFTDSVYLFLMFAFLTAAADNTLSPAVESMLALVDEKHDKDGTIYGFTGIFTDFGFIVGPLMSGLLLQMFGFRGVFAFLAFLLLADWVVGAVMLRNFKELKKVAIRIPTDFHLGGTPVQK